MSRLIIIGTDTLYAHSADLESWSKKCHTLLYNFHDYVQFRVTPYIRPNDDGRVRIEHVCRLWLIFDPRKKIWKTIGITHYSKVFFCTDLFTRRRKASSYSLFYDTLRRHLDIRNRNHPTCLTWLSVESCFSQNLCRDVLFYHFLQDIARVVSFDDFFVSDARWTRLLRVSTWATHSSTIFSSTKKYQRILFIL